MRQHRGNKVSIGDLLYVSFIYLRTINLMFHFIFTKNFKPINIESYDSKRFALELSTARQTIFQTLNIHSLNTFSNNIINSRRSPSLKPER